jgi:hypothetical protein
VWFTWFARNPFYRKVFKESINNWNEMKRPILQKKILRLRIMQGSTLDDPKLGGKYA